MKLNEDPWTLIDEVATEMGVKPDTLRKWHERKTVPHEKRLPLLQLITKRGIILSLDFFDRIPPPPEPVVASPAAE